MNSRSTQCYLVLATAVVATAPGGIRAQAQIPDGASDPVVVKARETAKAVAAAAASAQPTASAPFATPAPATRAASVATSAASPTAGSPAAASPTPSASGATAPSPGASPTPAAGGSPAGAAKSPGTITVPAGTTIPSGSPVIIVQAAPANGAGNVESTANNWLGGLIGLAILGAAGYFGIRAAKNRGMTVEGALKQMGVETQPAMPSGPNFAALKPAPAPMPPLPSLSELPLAGPASTGGLAMAGAATARKTIALVGVAGPVSGERFDLEDAALPFSVGRDDVNSLALTGDAAISRRHAQVIRQGTEWAVGDLGSSNGTFVNGARVKGQQPLRAGDEIQIGGSRFRFEG